jgi:hypothetical protein
MRVAMLVLFLATMAATASAAPCPPGRFAVDPADQAVVGPSIVAVIVAGDGSVTLEGCGPDAGEPVRTFKTRRRGTRLAARWDGCGELGPFRLSVRVAPSDCATLRGRLRVKRRVRRFTATRTTAPTSSSTTTTTMAPAVTTTTTLPPTPTTPQGLAAVLDGADVALSWTAAPASTGATTVRLLRRLDVAPTDAYDAQATLVYAGEDDAATHPTAALLPTTVETARTYHYAVFGCVSDGSCEGTGSRTTLAPTLVEALRGGGYVLHWRHASATVCADNTSLGTAAETSYADWWKRCDAMCATPETTTATARQLNATGVTEATAIGDVFAQRGIPIGRVLSSEFCRNVATAELMDFGPAIEQRPDLTFFVHDEANRCDASFAVIGEVPAAGTNTAVIGHAGFGGVCPTLGGLAWSEAAVFKPDGVGGALLLGTVVWDEWATLP